MPLQDSSFARKASRAQQDNASQRTRVLTAPPSVQDLEHCILAAQKLVGQPVVIAWKKEDKGANYLLTVMRATEAYDLSWMLHTDRGGALNVVWTYTSSDPELIHSLVTERVAEQGPAAVIPESLRPGTQPTMGDDKMATRVARGTTLEGEQSLFLDDYELIEVIGKGGMGIIYRALRKSTGTPVALKILRADLLVDQANVKRFEHEAAIASSLVHPNLVCVREYGVSRFGQPYLVMDYLDGKELQRVFADSGRMEIPSFINTFTQVCDALAYAHERGLVHRDIKPGNIMLVTDSSGRQTVKIIDFGIAKLFREQTPTSLTTTGQLLGSPAYMSPEQCGGAILDPRSDIYSLGCVMYEALTGAPPFRSSSLVATIMMQVNDPPPPFSSLLPDCVFPDGLESVVMKALQKNPAQRYQTAVELSEDLWIVAAGGTPSTVRDRLDVTDAVGDAESYPGLSPAASMLLTMAGVIGAEVLEAAARCERLIESHELTLPQAIQILRRLHHGSSNDAQILSGESAPVDSSNPGAEDEPS